MRCLRLKKRGGKSSTKSDGRSARECAFSKSSTATVHRAKEVRFASASESHSPFGKRKASSDVWLWRKLGSQNDVRGKVDLAYAHTREEQFIGAIAAVLDRYKTNASLLPSLSLAIDCDGAAHRVTEPLLSHLRALAKRQDDGFCSLPHDLKRSKGFLIQTPNSVV